MDNIRKFDNNQMIALKQFIDCDKFMILYNSIDSNFSSYQIDILGNAVKLGIPIDDVLNPRLSNDCMIELISAKMNGIDINGLDNELIDVSLLRKIIKIKIKEPNSDMSFIKNLSLDECNRLVYEYFEALKYNIGYSFKKYIDRNDIDREMFLTEFKYVVDESKSSLINKK